MGSSHYSRSKSKLINSPAWIGFWLLLCVMNVRIEVYILVAFIMAGLLTSLGRQFRHSVRPYFLPPAGTPPTAPNSFPQWPYPNLAKRIYDVIGWIMVQVNLNYIASSFVLLSFRDCIKAWQRMFWYTPCLVVFSILFFHYGGREVLRRGFEGNHRVPTAKDVPSPTVYPPSPQDKRRTKHSIGEMHAENEEVLDADGGLADGLMRDTELLDNKTCKLKEA